MVTKSNTKSVESKLSNNIYSEWNYIKRNLREICKDVCKPDESLKSKGQEEEALHRDITDSRCRLRKKKDDF